MVLETKYDINDKVYFMMDNVIYGGVILTANIPIIYDKTKYQTEYCVQYRKSLNSSDLAKTDIDERNLFTTIDDLVLDLETNVVDMETC